MEKSKKKKGLSRLFEIAGQKKGLLILAGLLSAGSAVCMLVPYWAVYEILKELLSNGSNLSALDGTDMMRWGLFGTISYSSMDERFTASLGLRADANNYSSAMKSLSDQLSPRIS